MTSSPKNTIKQKKKKRTELEKIWRNTKYENAAIEFDMLKNK